MDARKILNVAIAIFILIGLYLVTPPRHAVSPDYYQKSDAKVRLLILKHSWEPMADGDANLAIEAVNAAKANGLEIKEIGNYRIDKSGKRYYVDYENLAEFQSFISDSMKVDAEPGDTLIIFTIGHGFGDGSLDGLGQRSNVLKAIAGAAAENQQATIWWQLSCHAAAGMPAMTSLASDEQELLTVVNSSEANSVSAAGVQGEIMKKVFNALAKESPDLDVNGDGRITAKELRDFLNKGTSYRGVISTSDQDHIVFGYINLANQVPIYDWDFPGGELPKNYIPLPGKDKIQDW